MIAKLQLPLRQGIGLAIRQEIKQYFIDIYDQAQLSRQFGLDRDDWY